MTSYDWESIFKSKDEKELLKIFCGNSHLDFEAEIYAGLELKLRNYDFNKIEKVYQSKIEKLENEIKKYNDLNYIKSEFYRKQKYYIIGMIVFIYFLITEYREISQLFLKNKNNSIDENLRYFEIIYVLIIVLVAFFTAKWRYKYFKKKNKRNLIKKKEILNRLTLPNKNSIQFRFDNFEDK